MCPREDALSNLHSFTSPPCPLALALLYPVGTHPTNRPSLSKNTAISIFHPCLQNSNNCTVCKCLVPRSLGSQNFCLIFIIQSSPSEICKDIGAVCILHQPKSGVPGPPHRGVPRGVPEGPRGSQRDPEEELRSVFKGKVARNNGLKNDFFQFLT